MNPAIQLGTLPMGKVKNSAICAASPVEASAAPLPRAFATSMVGENISDDYTRKWSK